MNRALKREHDVSGVRFDVNRMPDNLFKITGTRGLSAPADLKTNRWARRMLGQLAHEENEMGPFEQQVETALAEAVDATGGELRVGDEVVYAPDFLDDLTSPAADEMANDVGVVKRITTMPIRTRDPDPELRATLTPKSLVTVDFDSAGRTKTIARNLVRTDRVR